MKFKIFTLHIVLVICGIGIAVVSVLFNNIPVIVALVLATIVVGIMIFRNWMNFVNGLLAKSSATLNNTNQLQSKKWMNSLDSVMRNQDLIHKKFEVSAQMISNLTHPERLETIDELIKDDAIGNALRNIRDEMKEIKDEDERQAWVSDGLAQFSAILRNKVEVKQYTQNIIGYLVKYLKANQGSFYIENKSEQKKCLDLVACYAYGKNKFLEDKIYEGQGILGQCMLEKDFIFITDIPSGYVKITSGLGEATPRNIVIAPLIFNETFCGVIEIASFQVLKPHAIEFIKKICVDIASEVVSIKNVEHTKSLLRQSDELGRELQLRENEMQKNLEQLAATQTEMTRKQIELSGIVSAIDSTLGTIEFDAKGKVIKHNVVLGRFLGYTENQLLRRDFAVVVYSEEADLWKRIIGGEIRYGDYETRSQSGHEVWLSITFTLVTDPQRNVEKVLCMVQDITQKKIKEQEFERLSLVANNTDNSVIITNKDGFIEYVNEGFIKMTGFGFVEAVGRKPSFLQGEKTDKTTVEKLHDAILKGEPIFEEILNYNKQKQTYWISLAINPVKDEYGNVEKFISIQADITKTKIKALDFHQKIEALSRSNAILELNKEGVITEINDNYLQILNYTKEEVIGKPYSMLSGKESTFPKVMSTIHEHGLQSGVYSRYDKHGEKHCIKLMDYPVLDLDGNIEKIIEFGVDVSNEKRLEKEAEHRQAELKGYLTGVNNTIASVEFNFDGSFKKANEIFLRIMGYTMEELAATNYQSLVAEEHIAIMMWESLRLGKFFSGEFKMIDKEGKELWLNGTLNPIIIEGNVPEKILMLAQFTTQEKEKLNDLSAMVNAFKSTLPIIEFTSSFKCKSANEIAMKIFGLSRLELRTKTVLDFIAPFFHATWISSQTDFFKEDFSILTLPFKVGSEVANYEVSVSIVRNLDGTVGKFILLLVRETHSEMKVLAAG